MSRSLFFVLGLMVACGPTPQGGPGGAGGEGSADASLAPDAYRWPSPNEFADAAPAQQCSKMDILFVVDNSGSMLEEQTNLATNFPLFMQVLDAAADLDYRVGVTTTGRDYTWSLETPIGPIPSSQTGGDNGALLQRCDMTKRWVDKGDPMASETFSCAAQVGDQGPAMEMPLGAIRDAFGARISDGTNSGFLRDDALLAIVILTDEDDCSYEQSETFGLTELTCQSRLPQVSDYKSFLDNVTGGPGRWAVAVIAGPGPGQCSSDFGDAAEATRLKELVSLAGSNGVFSSICDGDLASALDQALQTFDTACDDFPPID